MRLPGLSRVLPFAVLLIACGGRTRASGSGSAAAAGSGGNAGGGAGVGGGQASSSGGVCAVPPPSPPVFEGGPPGSYGCAAKVDGTWEERPCSGELWLRNPVGVPVQAAMDFAFTPAELSPSLTDALRVEVGFPDPDEAWRAVWSKQAADGTSFTVTAADGTTTVRLGANELALEPVPLAPCARLTARGAVSGPWGTPLSLAMSATLTDHTGAVVDTSAGESFQPASHPTVKGAAGATSGVPPR